MSHKIRIGVNYGPSNGYKSPKERLKVIMDIEGKRLGDIALLFGVNPSRLSTCLNSGTNEELMARIKKYIDYKEKELCIE